MTAGKVYAALWIGWLAIFAAIEVSALATGKSQFTLSQYVWRLESLGTAWTFLRYFVAVFCLWLTLHLTFGWFG